MTETQVLGRRLALPLGALVLASVAAETFMASIDNSLSVPGGRFLAISSVIPRFAAIVGGGSLLVYGWDASDKARTKRRAGQAMLVFALLALIPLLVLFLSFSAATTGLGPGGLFRSKVQLVRALLCYLSLAAMLLAAGKFLLARSRVES